MDTLKSHIRDRQVTSFAAAVAGLGLLVAATPAASAAHPTMCAAGDKPAFSCPLAKGGKTVSVCAKADNSFYYAYGKPGTKADMTWPADGAPATGLTFTHLFFFGATGGNAFAFQNNGYKYIVYSVSGTQFEDGGVVVTKDGERTPVKDTHCADDGKSKTEAYEVFDVARKLPEDKDIADHGVPSK